MTPRGNNEFMSTHLTIGQGNSRPKQRRVVAWDSQAREISHDTRPKYLALDRYSTSGADRSNSRKSDDLAFYPKACRVLARFPWVVVLGDGDCVAKTTNLTGSISA
jgi:hypothetical protein